MTGFESTDGQVRGHIDEVVRSIDGQRFAPADAEWICEAGRYERWAERVGHGGVALQRRLEIKGGAVVLRTPKLRAVRGGAGRDVFGGAECAASRRITEALRARGELWDCVADACAAEIFSGAQWQHCVVHFYRNDL